MKCVGQFCQIAVSKLIGIIVHHFKYKHVARNKCVYGAECCRCHGVDLCVTLATAQADVEALQSLTGHVVDPDARVAIVGPVRAEDMGVEKIVRSLPFVAERSERLSCRGVDLHHWLILRGADGDKSVAGGKRHGADHFVDHYGRGDAVGGKRIGGIYCDVVGEIYLDRWFGFYRRGT